jgi:hypothetical protein
VARSKGVTTPNALYYGDNLEVLRRDIADGERDGRAGSVLGYGRFANRYTP